LELERAGQDVILEALVPVVDDEKPWSIKASGRYVAKTRTLTVDFGFDGFRPAGIASLSPQLSQLSAVDLRLTGQLSSSLTLLDNAARMDRLAFDFKGDHGTLKMPGATPRDFVVRSLAVKGAVTNGFDRLSLEQFRMESEADDGHVVTFNLSGNAEGLTGQPKITADLGIDDMSLAALKSYWPEGVKDNAHTWISKNLNKGSLSQSHFHVVLTGP
jgi:hypothetical protein